MGITCLNHAVLFVNDIERSLAFYTDVLGLRRIDIRRRDSPVRLPPAPGSTNDHDLGLFEIELRPGCPAPDAPRSGSTTWSGDRHAGGDEAAGDPLPTSAPRLQVGPRHDKESLR